MFKADGAGRRLLCGAVLTLSVFSLLFMFLWPDEDIPTEKYLSRGAQIPAVTRLPVMPASWLLNAGDAAALDELPNIGPTLAQRIIDNRLADGPFAFPEDLMEVKGIGKKTCEGIMKWLEEHPEKEFLIQTTME